MSTPTPQPTMKRARILTMLLTVVGMVGVLIGFAAWAVSSPVSGSPDDDYHLGSIWCPRPISESGCTFEIKDGVISSVEVPEPITDAKECVAFKPEKDASCALDAADSELVPRNDSTTVIIPGVSTSSIISLWVKTCSAPSSPCASPTY